MIKWIKMGIGLSRGLWGKILKEVFLHGEKCLFDEYIVRIKKKGLRNKKKIEQKLRG